MKYSEKLLNYFHQRHHAGNLDPADNVRRVQVGNADNREVLVLTIAYQGNNIIAAKFQASGSVALIAGGEFICTWLENKTWQDLPSLTPEYILDCLELTKLNIHVANLLATAVKKMLGFA